MSRLNLLIEVADFGRSQREIVAERDCQAVKRASGHEICGSAEAACGYQRGGRRTEDEQVLQADCDCHHDSTHDRQGHREGAARWIRLLAERYRFNQL